MDNGKQVLTTGQVARICNVAPRTVSKWFDTGHLRGYRIPGSRDRRIPLNQLVRFMKANGIPLDKLENGLTRLLIVDEQKDLTDLLAGALTDRNGYEVRVAANAFEAGGITQEFCPAVVVADVDLPGIDGRTLSRFIAGRSELHGIRLIGMSASLDDTERQTLRQEGFHNTLAKPFNIQQLIQVIEATLRAEVA
ncbi:MAG: response regulator [Phycisphaerales bacterium]|nr:response regulator [Phycisphaerales bacterium]